MNWTRNNTNTDEAGKASIDELLESETQQLVRRMVHSLPQDVPSMAWRGALNARLADRVTRSRSRRRLWWVVSPSFGFVAAAVVFMVVSMSGPKHHLATPPSPPAVSLEDQLFASHRDSMTTQDVVGSGLSSQEVQQSSEDSNAGETPAS